jgi:ppGpp synthetase/RelA/SpoT-type nucleotidyltranferase
MTNVVDHRAVARFLETQGPGYRRLLEWIVEFLHDVADRPVAKGCVYRIYTRADKQSGNIYKDVWKIVQKVNSERNKKPSFEIFELHDIIGVTAVVIYPSDIDIIRKVIDADIAGNRLISHSDTLKDGSFVCYGEKKEERGYYAHHYHLERPEPQFFNRRCELQIKTVLHDAWGAKTHDLTYKPEGELDPRMAEQIQALGDGLAVVDQQSELLKQLIERRWALDKRKARSAKLSLMKVTANPDTSTTTSPDDVRRNEDFLAIRSEILKDDEQLANQPLASNELQRLVGRLDSYALRRYDHNSCRLFCLLAVIVGTEEMARMALDRIDQWLTVAATRALQSEAHRFKALALFAFGEKVEAINEAQRALEVWRSGGREEAEKEDPLAAQLKEIQIKNRLAYFYADIAGSDAARKMNAADEATRYIKDIDDGIAVLKVASGGSMPDLHTENQILDTRGAVVIAFGEKAGQVREGLDTCRKARDELRKFDKQLADSFFDLHELRAFQRILDLEQEAEITSRRGGSSSSPSSWPALPSR